MSVMIPGVTASAMVEPPPPVTVVVAVVINPATDTLRVDKIGGAGSLSIEWGDGTISSPSGAITKTYSSPGTYVVSISRNVATEIWVYGIALQEVISIEFGLTRIMFEGAINLTAVPESIPSSITSAFRMFRECESLDNTISGWDVSNITNMQTMFAFTSSFNIDISSWDVSNVENMSNMFNGCDSFNIDISGWDVSSVILMGQMFLNASSFNQDLSLWCVSNFVSEPSSFSTGATSWVLPKPVWGTCPGA